MARLRSEGVPHQMAYFMKVTTLLLNTTPKLGPKKKSSFDALAFFDSTSGTRRIVKYRRSQKIYSQGDPATTVLYIQQGIVKHAVVNDVGKEAIVAVFGPYAFLGEQCLAGQNVRMATAIAVTPTTLLVIERQEMIHVLHADQAFSNCFISYILARTIHTEDNLIDQLLNSAEKRLARALLLLDRYSVQRLSAKILPKVSQEVLAEMIGTTRSRVNFFMKNFEKMGLIGYDGGLHINPSLLNFVQHGEIPIGTRRQSSFRISPRRSSRIVSERTSLVDRAG